MHKTARLDRRSRPAPLMTRASMSTCRSSTFKTDLNAGTCAYQWITPDLIDDMHDGTDADDDNFIKAVVPEIQKSAQYKAGGVIFITGDEGENGSDDILFVAVSNRAKPNYVSMTQARQSVCKT
jgi:hypothetical protein